MKLRALVFILALTAGLLAQTATQITPAPAQGIPAASDTKPQCPCCQKSGDEKGEMACCAHHAKAEQSDKKTMSCCHGKDSMSCMKGEKDKSAEAACGKGKCCGEKGCAMGDKKEGEMAMSCCGGKSQCGMHQGHQHGDMKE